MNIFARTVLGLITIFCQSPANASSSEAYLTAMESGTAHFRQSDFNRAKMDFDSALALAIQEENTHKINCSRFNLYGVDFKLNKLDDAKSELEKILLTIKDDSIDLGIDRSQIQTDLALIYVAKGQFAPASKLYEQALADRKQKKQDLLVAKSLVNIGALQEREGKFGEAQRSFRDALAICRRTQPAPLKLVQQIANNSGVLYMKMHDFDSALTVLTESTSVAEKLYGPESMVTAVAIGNQADAFEQKGNTEQAMKYYMKALAVMHRVDPGGSLPIMNLEINIGEALLKQGKAAESIKYLMSAKEIAKNILGSSNTAYKHILAVLAKAYEKNNQMNESKAVLEESARILKPRS